MIRKAFVTLSVVAALCCLSSIASAQTVDDIIAKNLAAKGGAEKLKSIQSLRSTGTMSAQGQSFTLTASAKRPNMTRQEMVVLGQTILMVFDGTTARMINPMVGAAPMDIPAEQVEMIKDQSDMDGPLVDYKTKGNTIILVDTVTLDGKPNYHLRVERKSLPTQDVYLDQQTYLETKVSTTVPGSGVFETEFSDYRAVDGFTMPFSIKTVAAGMTLSELKLTKIEINPVLDDSIFKIK
jgi:outer membrane lipoprotein-sorting protein